MCAGYLLFANTPCVPTYARSAYGRLSVLWGVLCLPTAIIHRPYGACITLITCTLEVLDSTRAGQIREYLFENRIDIVTVISSALK